ncbi:MAG: hypothetical protein LBK63_03235 [Treponema sp.]|jgi:hypothetical protein|nr:hypothetical protein [Treponema sp.]
MKKESIVSILLTIFFTFIFGNGTIFASFLFDTLASGQESEVIVLTANDVAAIKGGVSTGGGSGGLFKTTITPASSTVNIQLSNVPYIYQENDYPISGYVDRSEAYCGLASALMVRTKLKYKEIAYSIGHGFDYQWMEKIDRWLDLRWDSKHINIYPTGLVFVGSNMNSENFDNTKSILREIYLTKDDPNTGDSVFFHPNNTDRISGLDMQLQEPDMAMNNIWNHINANKQPVVVITDSVLLGYYFTDRRSQYPSENMPRVLHYVVIAGIRNTNSYREYLILDPLQIRGTRYLKEEELKDVITLKKDRSTFISQDQWVFEYTMTTGSRGSYIMLVNGS